MNPSRLAAIDGGIIDNPAPATRLRRVPLAPDLGASGLTFPAHPSSRHSLVHRRLPGDPLSLERKARYPLRLLRQFESLIAGELPGQPQPLC